MRSNGAKKTEKSTDGFTSIISSGQTIHGGSPILSNRVRGLETYQQSEIRNRHVRDFDMGKMNFINFSTISIAADTQTSSSL